MAGEHPVAVEVVGLVVSPGHNYWFHSRDPEDGVGPHRTERPSAVRVVAHHGIVGDRFYGRASRLASAVSFLAVEAVEAVAADLGLAPGALDPGLTRRNVLVRGVDLNGLRHGAFALDCGDGPVWFAAAGETSPCAWMDAVLAPGARAALRGRGGLRADPTTSGWLRMGSAVLLTGVDLDPARAGAALRRPTHLP